MGQRVLAMNIENSCIYFWGGSGGWGLETMFMYLKTTLTLKPLATIV